MSKAGPAREVDGGVTRRVIASTMLYVVAAVTAGRMKTSVARWQAVSRWTPMTDDSEAIAESSNNN